jgi:glycosyltransferase involved in cell wall biosynthesis
MPTVLLLASDLGPSGAARQVGLLAPALPPGRFRVEVGVLGPADTPAADDLRRAGVPVRPLPLRRGLDLRGVRRLRRAVAAANPAVVHAWGPAAVRAAGLVSGVRLVASAAEPPGGVAGWLTARLLRRADRVVAATRAGGDRLHRLGVPSDRLALIHPGVRPAPTPPDRAAFLRGLGLPPDARLVMTAGRLDAGLKPAVWAFDMLRYDFRNLYLVAFGGGPDRAGLEGFGRSLAADDWRVRFPGRRADLPAVLGLAEVVWVLQEKGGLNLALEAMAAGRPVVGWGTPDLAEVVEDGVTGLLADRREKARVSARTHNLLTDPATAAALGGAGRARAAEHFGAGRMADHYARVYAELAAR